MGLVADRVVPMDVRSMVVAWPEDAPRGAVTRFVAEHPISRSQFYAIRARVAGEGALAALQPRPRSPRGLRHPQAIPVAVEDLAVEIRKDLADQGLDHGPVTVRVHLQRAGVATPAASTLARVFTRRGMVVPQPRKRPHASYRRFSFAMVHECWQLDAFEWRLADATPVVIFQLLDDCSRFLVASHVALGERAEDAIHVVTKGIDRFQVPCLLLTDNGTAFNRDRLGIQTQLVASLTTLGCRPITGRAGHPQTQGKDERVHATTQNWLRAHPAPATVAELQSQVDAFDDYYNRTRPHQALALQTPAQAMAAAPVAIPPTPPAPTRPPRPVTAVKRRVATTGQISINTAYVNLGTRHAGTTVTVILSPATANIFDETGTHIRSITLIPGQTYYSNGRPRGRPPKNRPH